MELPARWSPLRIEIPPAARDWAVHRRFYCHEQRLVIELDGQSHDGQADYDRERESYLTSQNLRVIRFTNDDVLHDLEPVLQAILMACNIDPDTGGRMGTPSP